MKLKYCLVDNPVTDANDCRARVADFEWITEQKIFEFIARPGSGINMAEASQLSDAHGSL